MQTTPCVHLVPVTSSLCFPPYFCRERKTTGDENGSDISNLKIFSDSCCDLSHIISVSCMICRPGLIFYCQITLAFECLLMSSLNPWCFWFRIQYSWNIVDKFNAYFTLRCFSFKVHSLKMRLQKQTITQRETLHGPGLSSQLVMYVTKAEYSVKDLLHEY